MRIKSVLFDMGDIFFEANYWRKWMYEKFLSENLFEGSFSDFYDLYEKFLLPVYKGEKSYLETYQEFLTFIGIGNKVEFQKVSFEIKEYFEHTRKLFPEVKETLNGLKDLGITTVVITDNEQSENAIRNSIFKRFEINDMIDMVFSSKTYNLTKPDPKIFRLVLEKLKQTTEEVIFVGHDKEELDGAEELGIKSVEFNNYLGLANKASFRINKFSKLLFIVKELNNE